MSLCTILTGQTEEEQLDALSDAVLNNEQLGTSLADLYERATTEAHVPQNPITGVFIAQFDLHIQEMSKTED
jgi:hypothetical protein